MQTVQRGNCDSLAANLLRTEKKILLITGKSKASIYFKLLNAYQLKAQLEKTIAKKLQK